jgi:plasmid maintenance system antidote protein VapI
LKNSFIKEIKDIKKRQPTHPGGILKRHYIEPLSLTISEVAKGLGVSRKAVTLSLLNVIK